MNNKAQQLQLKAVLLGIPLLCEYCRAYCVQTAWNYDEEQEELSSNSVSVCSKQPHAYSVRYGEDTPDANEWTKHVTKASSCPDFELYPYFSDKVKDTFTG